MIYRIDVRTRQTARAAADPLGESVRHQIEELGTPVGQVSTRRIYLLDTDAPEPDVRRIAAELLADPVVEHAELLTQAPTGDGRSRIEIHLKPGVMDPVSGSTEMAIRDMQLPVREVRTGRAYILQQTVERDRLAEIASRVLANGVIESVHLEPFLPKQFPASPVYDFRLRHVPLRDLDDEQLKKLSREGHLFLSLKEMRTVQAYFREQGREPTDIELETIAQTWSEHCVHKTLKSAVEVEVRDEKGQVIGNRRYGNLIRDTIFRSTQDLIAADKGDFCLSVFKDNAGVVAFDETDAVCFKVETHNHPSALEPYGGSATGIGGCIRDVMGTGLSAKPVANTDVFCVAYPFDPDSRDPVRRSFTAPNPLPRGVIHPKRILQQIVAGVRDYGNRMGIPTVNGAVYFDNRYVGNPLVFCGCMGLIPRDKIHKQARDGDAVVVMGGRTGRDGIHGATFSSAELTDTHVDEFSHAVQIGNAITQKKMADVILQARDRGLFTAITDCGAGGLSSAVGEMGEKVGAAVQLDRVPLKYAGLRYDEIWISEAQERMVLAVPKEKVDELLDLSRSEDVEATVIGQYGTPDRQLVLHYHGQEVGRLSMQFLHDGIPMPTRKAVVVERTTGVPPVPSTQVHGQDTRGAANLRDRLLRTLAHPNVASKHWVIRQYDHEVQGGSVVKPLVGPMQIGPSDASVVRPKLDSFRAVALGCGLVPHIDDPYQMAVAAIDEAVRNVVAVGASPSKVAILDNFCWPSADDEQTMGALVRACEACRDTALAYGIPFISGKDSLHNQFTNSETGQVIRIPNTLLISAMAVLDDARRCVTMDLKGGRDAVLALVEPGEQSLTGYIATHRAVSELIAKELVESCHDVSEGGYLTAVAEMCIASGLGARLNHLPEIDPFAEGNARYVIELNALGLDAAKKQVARHGARLTELGTVSAVPAALEITRPGPNNSTAYELQAFVDEMTKAWRGTLDW